MFDKEQYKLKQKYSTYKRILDGYLLFMNEIEL